jgi:hypothetical protein
MTAPAALATATYRSEVGLEEISAGARILPLSSLCTLAYRGPLAIGGIAYARGLVLEQTSRLASDDL